MTGTRHIDILRGDAGPNLLRGGNGPDVLDGRGGADRVQAGPGADMIEARDGAADEVDCGTEADTVTADLQGVDSLVACESVAFATPPPAEPSAPAAGPGGGVPVVTGVGRPPAPVIRELRLAPTPFAAQASGPSARAIGLGTRGTAVSFSLDRAAEVTFRVVRRRAGRVVGGRCATPTKANRAARRCTRLIAVPGPFARTASPGANRFRFSGRVGARALAPGAYRLQATPRTDGRAGATVSAAFRIRP